MNTGDLINATNPTCWKLQETVYQQVAAASWNKLLGRRIDVSVLILQFRRPLKAAYHDTKTTSKFVK